MTKEFERLQKLISPGDQLIITYNFGAYSVEVLGFLKKGEEYLLGYTRNSALYLIKAPYPCLYIQHTDGFRAAWYYASFIELLKKGFVKIEKPRYLAKDDKSFEEIFE